MASQGMIYLPLTLWSGLPFFPSLTLFQPHQPTGCFSNNTSILWPQSLCSCPALCPELCSPRELHGSIHQVLLSLCSNDFSIESTSLTSMWHSFSLTWFYLLLFPIIKHVLQVCWLIPCLILIVLSELCDGCSITVSFAWRQVGTGWIMWNGRLLTQDMASLKHLGISGPRSPLS